MQCLEVSGAVRQI